MVTDDENELLVAAFRQLSRGAGLVARHQRKNVAEVELCLPLAAADARNLVRRVLSGQGRLLGGPAAVESPYMRAILNWGTWNLNPSVVTVGFDPGVGGTTLTVRGVSCEGLIRQRAGEEAARRVAQLINAAARRS